jgi:hypothetical protein
MSDRRRSWFALEVLFLLGLAAGLALAKLPSLEIAAVMILGWVIVALLEWAAWRGEPHYGSGLPPRYYVPGLNLPPPQPLEQVATGYPEAARDEAPTWIASAALRQEMLGEWPVSGATSGAEPDAEVVDPWLVIGLPAAPLGELEDEREPEPELMPEPEPAPDPEPEPEPVPEPAPEAEPELLPAALRQGGAVAVLARSFHGAARYSLDPLAEAPARRRFGRGGGEPAPTIDVPARPAGVRPLPARRPPA